MGIFREANELVELIERVQQARNASLAAARSLEDRRAAEILSDATILVGAMHAYSDACRRICGKLLSFDGSWRPNDRDEALQAFQEWMDSRPIEPEIQTQLESLAQVRSDSSALADLLASGREFSEKSIGELVATKTNHSMRKRIELALRGANSDEGARAVSRWASQTLRTIDHGDAPLGDADRAFARLRAELREYGGVTLIDRASGQSREPAGVTAPLVITPTRRLRAMPTMRPSRAKVLVGAVLLLLALGGVYIVDDVESGDSPARSLGPADSGLVRFLQDNVIDRQNYARCYSAADVPPHASARIQCHLDGTVVVYTSWAGTRAKQNYFGPIYNPVAEGAAAPFSKRIGSCLPYFTWHRDAYGAVPRISGEVVSRSSGHNAQFLWEYDNSMVTGQATGPATILGRLCNSPSPF